MRTLDRERFEAVLIGLLDPPFGTDLQEALAQDGVPVWYLGERRGFDRQTIVRFTHILDPRGPHVGSTPSLDLQGLAQHAPSGNQQEGLR
jgi:hypothetical protein